MFYRIFPVFVILICGIFLLSPFITAGAESVSSLNPTPINPSRGVNLQIIKSTPVIKVNWTPDLKPISTQITKLVVTPLIKAPVNLSIIRDLPTILENPTTLVYVTLPANYTPTAYHGKGNPTPIKPTPTPTKIVSTLNFSMPYNSVHPLLPGGVGILP